MKLIRTTGAAISSGNKISIGLFDRAPGESGLRRTSGTVAAASKSHTAVGVRICAAASRNPASASKVKPNGIATTADSPMRPRTDRPQPYAAAKIHNVARPAVRVPLKVRRTTQAHANAMAVTTDAYLLPAASAAMTITAIVQNMSHSISVPGLIGFRTL